MNLQPVLFSPTIVKKGWGREVILDNTDEYCGKLLQFNADAEFSFHFHVNKAETFYVLEGELRFYYFDLTIGAEQSIVIRKGECLRIPRFSPHKLHAIKKSTIIEVSTHHEDEDSYRIGEGDSQK